MLNGVQDPGARPRRRRLTRARIGLCVVLGLMAPGLAAARVDDDLRRLYDSFAVQSTPAGAYQSQSRGYYTGGTMQVRVPMQNFNLGTLDPPRLGMGCNGIDLHFGGLSYVSLDRFTQLLTQMGTSAVMGYAWHLAMEVLCPTCNSVLKQLTALSQQINNVANISPCRMGTQLANTLASLDGQGAPKNDTLFTEWQRRRAELGQIGDTLADTATTAAQPARNAVTALKGSERDVTGDLVELALATTGLDRDTITLIKSLVGTVVVNEAGVPVEVPPTLELAQLVETVEGTSVTLVQCPDPPACQGWTTGTTAQFKGLRQRLREALTDLVTQITTRQRLGGTTQTLIGQVPSPAYRILITARRNPDLMARLIDPVSTEAAYALAQQYIWYLRQNLPPTIAQVRVQRPNWSGDATRLYQRLAELHAEAETLRRAHVVRLDPKTEAELLSRPVSGERPR